MIDIRKYPSTVVASILFCGCSVLAYNEIKNNVEIEEEPLTISLKNKKTNEIMELRVTPATIDNYFNNKSKYNTPYIPPTFQTSIEELPALPPEPTSAEILYYLHVAPTVPVVVKSEPPKPKPEPPKVTKRTWRVPRSIVKGILHKESKSILRPDDTVLYVDKRRGKAGERGATQIKPDTFKEVAKEGESLRKLERDPQFAIEVTERILLKLRPRCKSWRETVAAYNGGFDNRHSYSAKSYADDVFSMT